MAMRVPARLTRDRVYRLLRTPPRPLLDSERRLAFFWTAKAGCTFGAKWFFAQAGMLDHALTTGRWVHSFRQTVFNKSASYRRALQEFLDEPSSFRKIKLVRNPFHRAVSSYIHANKTEYEDENLREFFGAYWMNRPGERFSFREFVDYLQSSDLVKCNPHHRTQTSPLERAGTLTMDHVVHLENSYEELPELESGLGLQSFDLDRLRSSRHHTRRSVSEHADCIADERFDFRTEEGAETQAPPTAPFYDDDLLRTVASLYSEDFENYGYSTDSL